MADFPRLSVSANRKVYAFFVSILFSRARLANTKQDKIMKLIVLYGDGNTGKTITLKMVYERLKKHNLLDVNCFRYYDRECHHYDFCDVLVFKKDQNFAIEESNAGLAEVQTIKEDANFEDLRKHFPEIDDEDVISKISGKSCEIGSDEPVDQEESNEELEVDDVPFNLQDAEQSENSEKLVKPNLEQIIEKIKSLKVEELQLIGLSLEGDYGFTHKISPKSPSTMHTRSLYKNLEELSFCDTIICACSKVDKTLSPTCKPANCIAWFFKKYAKSKAITMYVVETKHCCRSWSPRKNANEKNANAILSVV